MKTLLESPSIGDAYKQIRKLQPVSDKSIQNFILMGGFPRIHSLKNSDQRQQWFKDYITTYIERDLRDLAQIADLDVFQKVYKIYSFQTGNLLNYTNIADDLGISPNTIRKYYSVLLTSYQCRNLQPYGYSKRKQLIKAPQAILWRYWPDQLFHGK